MSVRLAVVVSGFPRTSETFAIGELLALARAGVLARIYATKAGDGAVPQPGVDELLPLVRHLPEGDETAKVAALLEDLDGLEGGPVDGLHGYFAHEPTALAAAAAERLGVGYSFSTHALDARKVPSRELAARARQAAGVIACNEDVAKYVDVPGATVRLLPHGVDVQRFRPSGDIGHGGPLRVLAVGRMVEKKGFPHLVDAVARASSEVVLRIVGTGVERERLERQVAELGLVARVELVGRRSHSELPDDFAWADVVAVPSVVDSLGDRDGLPNVALEAMACARPLVASDVAAMGAAVRASRAGTVVPPGDADAIAAALDELAADPRLRAVLGRAGRRAVESRWDLASCSHELVEHLTALHATAPVMEQASA